MKGASGEAKTRELKYRKIVEPAPQPLPLPLPPPNAGDADGRDPTLPPAPEAGGWAAAAKGRARNKPVFA